MESQSINSPVVSQRQTKTLKSLVSCILKDLVPTTIRNNSFVVNDVPEELQVTADPHPIATVLGSLFSSVAAHASESCIRVTAKAYSDVILVQVKDLSVSTGTLAYNLQPTQQIAEKIGGFLGITSQWKNETVIVFSFPNLPVAA